VEESLPPVVGQHSDRMQNILRAVLTEDVTVWVSAEKRNDKNTITGIVLTSFVFDGISGTKSLLIYCVYGYGDALSESWTSGVETLRKFAKVNECHRMIGYTNVPSLIALAKRSGADTQYTFVSFSLE
jgi:hypothetical protein